MATDNRTALTPINNGGFKPDQEERERLRTVTAFFIFGTLIYATYSLVIAGAQDILAGTFIQTSMVLVADIGPYFLVTLIAPYFMQKIPYFARITTVFLSGIGGFLMLSFSKQVYWKLIGVGIASFGYGVGEVTFLALTSFYHEVTVTAYSAGTGAGFVLAPLYYTGKFVFICSVCVVKLLNLSFLLTPHHMVYICYQFKIRISFDKYFISHFRELKNSTVKPSSCCSLFQD